MAEEITPRRRRRAARENDTTINKDTDVKREASIGGASSTRTWTQPFCALYPRFFRRMKSHIFLHFSTQPFPEDVSIQTPFHFSFSFFSSPFFPPLPPPLPSSHISGTHHFSPLSPWSGLILFTHFHPDREVVKRLEFPRTIRNDVARNRKNILDSKQFGLQSICRVPTDQAWGKCQNGAKNAFCGQSCGVRGET